MSDSAAPKCRAFACSIALFMGRSGSYRQKCRFCALTEPHPTISTLFYISIHCHVSIFVRDPFTMGRLRVDRFGYDAFWRVHLNGDVLLIDLNWARFAYAPSALLNTRAV